MKRGFARAGLVAATACLSLAACKTLPPAVSTALVSFGQDVLAAAAQNFAPQYSSSLQDLFFAMAEGATGMPFTQAPAGADPYAQDGYYDGNAGYDGAYADGQYGAPYPDYGQPPYAQDPYPQDPYPQDPYASEPYAQAPYAQDPYAQGQYPQAQPAPGQPAPYDPQQYGQPPYGQPAYATPGYVDAGAVQAGPHGAAAPAGIGLEVALLAQQRTPDGQVTLRPVRDGETLYDGRGDPARGDKIKIFFSASCACHVYVIGIDATGYVAQIFPESPGASSLVTPGAKYLVPGGTGWWGLDEYRGVEQVYFIASRVRRPDIENLVAQLAGQRPSLPASYRAVREPAIVPVQRGLVQVQSAAPTVVPTEYGAGQPVSPTLFQSTVADADLVITRWFHHQ
ncbi:MAG TPA: DUF4384 domain-containing protein [Woeseiaceae bacterium]|nr:DUF4384 domain-containing protein [Woeseiaceae bacterium]